MKTLTTLLTGIVIGSVATALQGAVPVGPVDEATKQALMAVKNGIVAGHQKKDRAALDRLYADDYTAIDSKGTIRSKQHLLDGLPTDAVFGLTQLSTPAVAWIALALGAVGGVANLAIRRPAQAPAHA